MRNILRVAALLVLLGVGVEWKLHGRKGWWTHNSEVHYVTEPVTGIEQPITEPKFVPGYDFLGGGFAVAAVLAGVSFLFRKKR